MYCYFSPYDNGGGGQPSQPSVPMFRVPTVNLSNSMYGGGGGFFNPSVFYGTPVMPRSIAQYPANYPRFSGNGMNLPTPPQLPQLPNFGSPYFQQQQQQQQQQFQNPHGFMMHAIEGPPVPSRLTLQGVKNRAQLIELIFFNGIDAIPANEHPSMFNRVLATKQGLIGTEHVIQIMCESNSDYETYLCRNCEYWNSPGNMLEHLQSEDHQLKHMKKKYQRNFREIHVSRKRDRQEKIDKYVKCISIVETPKVVKRARTVLPLDIMYKIWPTFMDEFDHSWKPVLVKNEPADTQPNFKVEIPDMGYQNPQGDNDDNDIITIDSDEDDDNVPATYNQRSIPLPPIKKEVIPNVFSNAIKDSCVYALVFIRHEALVKEKIEKKKVEEICKLFGVTTDMLFSDEILDYAGKKIGNIGILVAIAANFSNPGVTLSYLFKKFGKNASSLPPQHPSITLLELGLDKEKTAKLIRDVDMILNPDFKTTPSTAFTRKPTKQPFINNNHYRFDRPLVPYDGEYIEGDDDEDEYPPTKQRKYYH